MDNPVVTIIILMAALVAFLFLFYIVDKFSKDKAKADKPAAPVPAASKPEVAADKKEGVAAPQIIKESAGSHLADEMESLISKAKPKKDEKQVAASHRGNLSGRRERMQAIYEKKYKARSESFCECDEHGDNNNFVVDGVEITGEDVKKLTALHNLFERKAGE